MDHYLDYIDTIYKNAIESIKKQHADWKIDRDFTVYCKVTPIIKNLNFQTSLQLQKRNKTSVIFEQIINGRRARQYFDEYSIIKTLIYLYDVEENVGDSIYCGMCNLIKDKGTDVSFKIGTEEFSFKGIKYLPYDKLFLTYADYEISINDFIALLNLVIEKDRYSKESENGKGTILKYILFLLLCSSRTKLEQKENMVNILKKMKLYKDNTLISYKDKINKTGEKKLYFKSEILMNLL